MALIKNEKTISLNDIRTGQVLKIIYDGDEDLILVVDPKAETVVDSSQGRSGKLHAIKLRNLSEYDMFQLIKLIRDIKTVNPRLIYEEFKLTPYAEGRRNYRTYTRNKIARISRVTIGQVTRGTKKLVVGDSVLYGVQHGSHVEVSINHYSNIIDEIRNKNYQIFYEGIRDKPETVILELFDILETFDASFDKSQLKFESWDIDVESGKTEYSTILPLFGPSFSDFKINVEKGVGNGSTEGKTLLDVLIMSAKPGGWVSSASPDNIKNIVSMAPTQISSQLNSYLNQNYSIDTFKKFHNLGQQYAFANFEGPEIEKNTSIEKLQRQVNLDRDISLKTYMETKPGVYFAGSGHIDLVKKLL